MSLKRVVAVLSMVSVFGMPCEDPSSCDVSGSDETSLLARRPRPHHRRRKSKSHKKCTKIGTLSLDGYYWPTQPGDANDKRTFCRVKPQDVDDFDYKCVKPFKPDEFESVISIVKGFNFYVAENQYTKGMTHAFQSAVLPLLKDDDVCAIICNVGFCSGYQSLTEKAITMLLKKKKWRHLQRKPMLLGSPILALQYAPSLIPDFNVRKPISPMQSHEAIMIITANFKSLKSKLHELFEHVLNSTVKEEGPESKLAHKDKYVRDWLHEHANMHCGEGMSLTCWGVVERIHGGHKTGKELAEHLNGAINNLTGRIVVVGWNEMPGYKPVDLSGGFHNAKMTSQHYKTYHWGGFEKIKKKIEGDGYKLKGVVVESTEQATNSNDIRLDYKLPVWDFTTMGICLGAAAKGPDFNRSNPRILEAVFDSDSFRECLSRWAMPGMLEKKFGKQKDGSFPFYNNLTQKDIDSLTCNGGRPCGFPAIGRLMENFDTGVPFHRRIRRVCHMTELCKCHNTDQQLTAQCDNICPGSGNCGGGSYEHEHGKRKGYPCGARGKKCKSVKYVPKRAAECYNLGPSSVWWKPGTTPQDK